MENHNFWKNSVNTKPGRIKKDNNVAGAAAAAGSSSFQKFQNSVQDAWEVGDDEFCIVSGLLSESKVSRKSFSSPAPANVIQTHKSNGTGSNRDKEPAAKENCQENRNVASAPSSSASPVPVVSADPKPKFHYPGRVQLLKFPSTIASKNDEYESKLEKYKTILEAPLLNLKALKELCWSGIPRKMRGVTWRLLSGHLPTSLERRESVLQRKRADYQKLVEQYFDVSNQNFEKNERLQDTQSFDQDDTYRQINIDVPRMNPQVPLFQQKWVQAMFERILFIWAIRHPASGYVQGINDLVTPFFIVFLQEALESGTVDIDTCKLEDLTTEQRHIIEADSFWCLSKFLDCIQDNYIFAQLGIQAKVNQLKELIQRIDGTLHRHLQTHGVDYLQFSFRWMNNLLTRELPLHCTIRLWDTYLAESDGFAVFQLYVCAAFLLNWRDQLLQENDFQGLMLLLQNLPTQNWSDSNISVLVAEAFRLQFTYSDAPKHLETKSS
ncbi:TBC1 domain family member 22B [Culicoides brevitarsis]|uniref:TBC1 domain family member 22B n=1 Tax=Culicoides brevitarsis TaxID=469753 RepID=UPI00307C4D91